MKLFVGLDVSLEKTAICVISEHGKILTEAQTASEPKALTRRIRELEGIIAAIVLEAGPLSQWLHRGLTEAGLEVVVMMTRQVKGALKAMPIKTDRRDAEGIARLLHLGWFGLSGYRSMLIKDFEKIPDLRFVIDRLACEPPIIAARLAFDCSSKGHFLGLRVDGR